MPPLTWAVRVLPWVAVAALGWAAAPASAAIRFDGPIQWSGWADGMRLASSTKKPVLLLLFTDSCPKCGLLGEVFRTNREIQKLAKSFVMVHVNSGTEPMEIVGRFARFGNYAPRIVFLRPDASPAAEIQSPNGAFPYYYQPSHPEYLIAAMTKARAVAGGPTASRPSKSDRRQGARPPGTVAASQGGPAQGFFVSFR